MKYINLEEYKDRPELIQTTDGKNVVFIHPVPGKEGTSKHFAVLFEDGGSCTFCKDGRYSKSSPTSSFILKPKKVTYIKSMKQIIEEFPDAYFEFAGSLVLNDTHILDPEQLCILGNRLPDKTPYIWPKILLEEREE